MFVTCISNVKGLTGDLQTLCHVTCVLLHLEMGSGDVSRGEQSLILSSVTTPTTQTQGVTWGWVQEPAQLFFCCFI